LGASALDDADFGEAIDPGAVIGNPDIKDPFRRK
jgi:hypothetical protein